MLVGRFRVNNERQSFTNRIFLISYTECFAWVRVSQVFEQSSISARANIDIQIGQYAAFFDAILD